MQFAQDVHYPERGDDWERRKPEDVGIDTDSLNEAIHYAQTIETTWPRKMRSHYTEMEKEESHPEVIGSIKDRGARPTGLYCGTAILSPSGARHSVLI